MDARARARSLWAGGGTGRRALVVLLVLAAVVAVIWLAITLAHRSAGGAPGGSGGRRGGRPSTTVGVATATRADIPITLDGLGTVTPAATVTVSPQVSGTITQILFREGQMVTKGQALAVIDPRPLQMALMQAQGTLTRDEAQLANARLLLARDRTLLAQDSIARQDVDTQAALVRQLEGTVTTDKAAVGTARLNLGFSQVIAPVAGRVGLRVVDVGNYIAAGAANGIVVLTAIAPIDVEFTVPQDDVPRLQTQSSQGVLPVTAFDRTKTIVLDQGQFSTLDNQIDTTTGTIRAKARFANAGGKLFPSQFVNVRVSLQTLRGAIVVPVTAVRTGPGGTFVWKLLPDKTVTMVKVVQGPATPTTVSVTQGLQAGEKVITEGGDRLTEGARVQLPGDKPGTGGGGGRRNRRGGQAGGGAAATATGAAPPAATAG
ncbi:MAG: efflux transporter periplasmic adaptor subunit, partial [Phenylobacterium sp.]|nr:efflux transporter periplasmic adaptor subunit [Phenylobacterium sp.]